MSLFETHTEAATRRRAVMQIASAPKLAPTKRRLSHTSAMRPFTAYAIALVLACTGLFGLDAWAQWLTDNNPDARDFFSSPGFTAFVVIGGSFAAFMTTIAVAALLLYPAPDGSQEPEDHA